MQIEADAEPNFLIIMLNNVQDPNASNPSQSAGKYLTNGEGAIKETFFFRGSAAGRVLLLVSQQQKFLFRQGGCKKWRQVDQGIANTDSKQNIFSQVFKKAKQPRNAKSTPNFKSWKVATPGTFIDTFENLSHHDEGN